MREKKEEVDAPEVKSGGVDGAADAAVISA